MYVARRRLRDIKPSIPIPDASNKIDAGSGILLLLAVMVASNPVLSKRNDALAPKPTTKSRVLPAATETPGMLKGKGTLKLEMTPSKIEALFSKT